jgi:hypothetical protein
MKPTAATTITWDAIRDAARAFTVLQEDEAGRLRGVIRARATAGRAFLHLFEEDGSHSKTNYSTQINSTGTPINLRLRHPGTGNR